MTVVINGTTGITNPNSMTIGNGGGSVATNTAVGASALAANTTGEANTAVGSNALLSNTTGYDNVAVGATHAGVFASALQKNTTGLRNTAVGAGALSENTTGSYNTASGLGALLSSTTGSYNTAHGTQALANNTTGGYNTALGYQAGYTVTTNTGNTFLGYTAGYSTTGSYNSFFGPGSGYSVTSGTKNTIIGGYNGNQGGLDIRTASNYVVLSDGDGNPRGIFDGSGNFLIGQVSGNVIGNRVNGSAFVDGGKQFQVRRAGTQVELGYAGTSGTNIVFYTDNGSSYVGAGSVSSNGSTTSYNTSSDYRLKENVEGLTGALSKVAQLRPVSWTWKEGFGGSSQNGEGFIAHELAEVCPQAVHGEKDAIGEDGKPVYQGIDTSFLVATLTAAIQELNAKFEAYKEAHP